jgi:GntR family transcriptional regulator
MTRSQDNTLSTSVDRNSPIPYYVQVADVLRGRIKAGEWRVGDQLPGEIELCSTFNVSRPVVRQALNTLIDEGLVLRLKGKGTFIAEPKIREGLFQQLTGFYQDMVDQEYTPVTKVLKQQITPASQHVATQLGLEPGAQVIEIERLRFVQDVPIVLVTTYIPYALCPALLSTDLSQRSLYAFLEQSGLIIVHGRRTMEAVPAKEYEANLLQVVLGAPLILLNSVSYMGDGTPLEYYYAFHRGDRSRFVVELVRIREQGGSEKLAPEETSLPPSNRFIEANEW